MLPGYNGKPLPPDAQALLDIAQLAGAVVEVSGGSGSTINLFVDGQKLAYINGTVIGRKCMFGYCFDDLRSVGNSCPIDEYQEYVGAVASRYQIQPDEIDVHFGTGTNTGKVHFLIKTFGAAKKILANRVHAAGVPVRAGDSATAVSEKKAIPSAGQQSSATRSVEAARPSVPERPVSQQTPGVHQAPVGTAGLNGQLRSLLNTAYPCAGFSGACAEMKHAPTEGYVPRGFYGGSGQLSEIELVLILAEPGDPKPGEATTDIESALACASDYYRSAKSIGHKNVMNILTRCFPGKSFEEIFRKTWITESVLCSAAVTTGKVPREVEAECYHRYLGKQLDMLPNAMVATFGTKAFQRVRRFTKRDIIPCGAVFPPGCNQSAVIQSWNALVSAFLAKAR